MIGSVLKVREDLRARGLLDDGYKLTEAGHAYCDDLIQRLPRQAHVTVKAPPVKWNTRRAR